MADAEELAGFLTAARGGDHDAYQKAIEQLAPFVHALVLARAPHNLSGSVVRHVMVQASVKLDPNLEPRPFIRELFALARKLGDEAAGPEDFASEPLLAEGRHLVERLRALTVTLRERLLMRLLEGLTGAEISELLEVNPEEVRASLDQALCEYLKQPPGTFKSDGYLWSLVGTPPDAVVTLENQLTPLRFDLAMLDSGEDGPTDVMEISSPSGKRKIKVPVPKGGKRPTGEASALGASKSSSALKAAGNSGSRLPAPATNSSSRLQAPPASGGTGSSARLQAPAAASGTGSSARLPSPAAQPSGLTGTYVRSPEPTDPSGAPLGASNETAAMLPPVQSAPTTQPAPSGAQPVQSSGTAVKTIHVSDLPAAAAFDLSMPSVETREAPPAAPEVSALNPLPADKPRRSKLGEDDDSTEVKPPPVVTAPVSAVPRHDPEVTQPPVNWKNSPLFKAPSEDDPGATRAILPPVAPFAPSGSIFASYRPFVVAAFFAAVAIGVVVLLLSGAENRVKKGWNLVPVVVATADLPEGTVISMEVLSQRSVPEQFVTSSVVRPDSTQFILNQKLLVPVQAGDPMLWTQFESSRTGERLSVKIQRRARAVSLHAPKTVAVGGWIQPGDHVDVVASVHTTGPEKVSVTLMQNLTVLSAGKTTETSLGSQREREKEYQDITVLLLPEEAEILTLASKLASLRFTLREGEDNDVSTERMQTRLSTLLDGQRVKVLQSRRYEAIKAIRKPKAPKL